MLIVRATKKFRDRVPAAPPTVGDEATNAFGPWYATVHFWRPQVALFVNETTLHPVFVPFAPGATVIARLPDALVSVLRAYAAPTEFIEREVAAMREYRLSATESRSIVGTMNEFGHMARRIRDLGRVSDLTALSLELGRVPCRVTGHAIFPYEELRSIVRRTD